MNENNDENGTKYVSLYEYLGHAAGKELGQKVAYEAAKAGIKPGTREVSNPVYKGIVYTYPGAFLELYFSNNDPDKELDDLPF